MLDVLCNQKRWRIIFLFLLVNQKLAAYRPHGYWVAAVATLYATYPIAFRLRNRKGLRHSMLALTPHSGDCSGASLEMPSEAFLHTKTHSLFCLVGVTLPATPAVRKQKSIAFSIQKSATLQKLQRYYW